MIGFNIVGKEQNINHTSKGVARRYEEMEKYNKIEFNAAIYPKVMSIILGKPVENSAAENIKNMEPELAVDLPRDVYLLYLQKMVNDHKEKEVELLRKYAYGVALNDSDYSALLDLIMIATPRNWVQSIPNGDIFAPFGVYVDTDENGIKKLNIIDGAEESIKVEAWEGIIIDILKQSAMDIIECFDFESAYTRQAANTSGDEKLHISLGAWKFSSDVAEQKLSNALRTAFMFTLVGYYSGDRKNQYTSFVEYFEAEFYKRVSLVYGMWISVEDKANIKYIPLYDSFYNLTGTSKSELISILKAILDNDSIAIDEKQTLKTQLIESAGEFHSNISATDIALEQTLIKPAINFILLREKAKETLKSAEILYTEDKYVDCANRCYYAMMFALKTLLEHQGKLANWKANELKESETHNSLENGLKDLVTSGELDTADEANFEYVKDQRWKCDYSLYSFQKADAAHCVNLTKQFFLKVETIIG